MSGAPLLSVTDLRVSFATKKGTVHAVNGVTFEAKRGEIVGIVGESGCGKSQTLRAIIGLTQDPGSIDGGIVEFQGENFLQMTPRQQRLIRGKDIGFISQSPFGALNPILSIAQQFANIIRAHRRASRRECREMSLRALQEVGIADPMRVLDGYAHELSGGMAQRVVIAMAMIHGPRLLLADEPTTALDVTVQRQILDLITGLISGGDRSMLLVTHDLSVVAQYCTRVVVMYAGKPVEVGDVRDVFHNPHHPYTRALLDAVPRSGGTIKGLTGTLPDVVNYPVGCPYASRCPHVTEVCREVAPTMTGDGLARAASCHHQLGEVPNRVTA
ncbi:ABC transporter ATP-binding protein [Salinibacterium sp. TMP30]|uniref:ABC transporter ATP-binding protein n=1 Tax=Salinibacterium sp. TMP30 TaxID=3138237 RepID=UPI00313A2E13